jgi:siroheme synthase
VKGEQIARPTLIIVGEVVALHDSMSKGLASHNY